MANTNQPDKTGKRQPLTDKAMHFVDMEILKRRYEWNDDCNCELCSGPEVLKSIHSIQNNDNLIG